MKERIKIAAVVLLIFALNWIFAHGVILAMLVDPLPILGGGIGYLPQLLERNLALYPPFSTFLFLSGSAFAFHFCSYPLACYCLRVLPTDASGKTRVWSLGALTFAVLASIFAIVAISFIDYISPIKCEVSGVLFSDAVTHGHYIGISFAVNILCIASPALLSHINSASNARRVSVLFLRKFDSPSDRPVLRALNSAVPLSLFPTFLLSPRPKSQDWDPSSLVTLRSSIFKWPMEYPRYVRIYDGEWQAHVRSLILHAKCVVIDISQRSNAVNQELSIIQDINANEKTIIICARNAKKEDREDCAKVLYYSINWQSSIVRTVILLSILVGPWLALFMLMIIADGPGISSLLAAMIFLLACIVVYPVAFQPSVVREDAVKISRAISELFPHQVLELNKAKRSLYKIGAITIFTLAVGSLLYVLSLRGIAESVDSGSTFFTKLYLAKGQSPSSIDRCGRPMIVLAIRSERDQLLKQLLLAGADPNQEFKEPAWLSSGESTPLIEAVLKSDLMTQILLEYGANPNTEIRRGFLSSNLQTALSIAVASGNKKSFDLLIKSGASIAVGEPLATAVRSGQHDFIAPLIELGVNPNVLYPEEYMGFVRRTALSMAVEQDDYRLVELLLRHRADPNVADQHLALFRNPTYTHNLELAKSPAVKELLTKYGGDMALISPPRPPNP